MIDNTQTAERVRRAPPWGAPYVFVLAVVDGDEPTQVHRLDRSETVIGRGPGVDFTLDDETISKRHCRVRLDGPVCLIWDLESRNGTRVNKRQLRPGTAQRLRHLDQVEVGGVRLLVLAGKFRTAAVSED